jgi:hypothetical protein
MKAVCKISKVKIVSCLFLMFIILGSYEKYYHKNYNYLYNVGARFWHTAKPLKQF